ncbi:S-adenosyl-L-methionine-dependent methyltransferase [Mycena haematopus]|nr:S-adenosyl-L-methionine-dependent methyltransferase [Mycena haematopus]
MPPRRPTAWEVSFPDELEEELPQLEDLHISRTNTSVPNALKRKSEANDNNDALQRATKRALRLSVAYYNPPRGLIKETANYLAPGEDPHPNPGKKPDRVLYNFCIFEPSIKNELVSLEELETGDNNRQFAAAGIVLLNDEDEEDYGQEDGADATEINEDGEGDHVRLDDIALCRFDYFTDAPVFIETQFATYELRGPSTLYKPYWMDFLAPRRVARAVLLSAMAHSRETLDQFRIGAPQFTNRDLREAVPYIRDELDENGNLLSRDCPLIKELLDSVSNADRRQRTRPRGRANPQRAFLGNPDLAVLKAESQTHVTPLIARLAKGYFDETLQVVGPPPQIPTKAEIDAQRATAFRFLKECTSKARIQERREAKVSFPSGRQYRQYAEEVAIGREVYKAGDFVCVRKGHYQNAPAPILTVDMPVDAQLEDFFWFARVVYFIVDSQKVHLQWLEHGTQIILQEMADPQELFLTMLCEDQPIVVIAGKISVVYSMSAPHKKTQYFIRQVYKEQDISCTSLDTKEMNRVFQKPPPNNCLPCLQTDLYNTDADWKVLKESTAQGGKAVAGVAFQGQKYHSNDFFLYNGGGSGPAQIGYMQGFLIPRNGTALPKIQFTMVGRIGDLKGAQLGQVACNLYPERHVFLTDQKAEILVNQLVSPIHVYAWDFFVDGAELKQWVDYSPYNFYCSYRLPSLTADWIQRVSVPKTLYICEFCPADMYRRENRELEFDAEHASKNYQCLDLFGGTGAFSQAFAEGSRGLLKSTHLIEISPSAARTAQKNSPNLVTYCQDANILLRYFIKSKANQNVEVPCQLWDNKTPVPPPMEPGKIGAIYAGLPCQSHSGLNMYRKVCYILSYPFSLLRYCQAEDRKSNLILTTLSYVDFLRPDFVFLENVPGFLKYNLLAEQASRHRVEGGIEMGGLKLVLRALLEMGYQWRFSLLQAGNYGAPQNRIRFFLVAAREGQPLPDMPQPTHDFEVTNQLRVQLPYNHRPRIGPIRTIRGRAPHASVSIEDAIADLLKWDWKHPEERSASPRLRQLINERKRSNIPAYKCDNKKAHCGPEGVIYGHEPRTSFQRQARERPTQDLQHFTRCLQLKTVERVVTIPLEVGADFRALPDNLAEWQFANPTSSVGRNKFRGGLYGRLDNRGYFPTTVTNMHPTAKQSKVLHPQCLRMVTVRELARSQGFPDWFCFVSVNDNVVTLHRQIGNAVPWQVSRALGRELRAALFEKWKTRKPLVGEEDARMEPAD